MENRRARRLSRREPPGVTFAHDTDARVAWKTWELPIAWKIIVDRSGYVAEAHVSLRGHKPVIEELRVRTKGPAGLRVTDLRSIPFKDLLAASVDYLAEPRYSDQDVEEGLRPGAVALRITGDGRLEEAPVYSSLMAEGRVRRQGQRITNEELEEVAALYREAVDKRKRPRKYIAEALRARGRPLSDSTIAKWIQHARRRGLLGQAPAPRKAGEK